MRIRDWDFIEDCNSKREQSRLNAVQFSVEPIRRSKETAYVAASRLPRDRSIARQRARDVARAAS